MIKNILFDLGGVLIDWNPKYLYRKIFVTEEAIDYFLSTVCTFEWNEEQDGGRSITEANQLLIEKYPHYTNEINMFYGRWIEMLGDAVSPTVDLLHQCLADPRYGVYALTNWSAETWPIAVSRFDFLGKFDGVLVSGEEKLKKPDPAIYKLVAARYNLDPTTTLFIDDNLRNIEAAKALGFQTVHFTSTDKVDEVRKLVFG